MLSGAKEIKEHRNIILLMSIFIFVGLSNVSAEVSPEKRRKFEIDDFGMQLRVGLKKSVYQKISTEDTKNRISELGNWQYAPKEIAFNISDKEIRIRSERDFVMIWYRSPISLVRGKNNSLNIFRDIVNDILGQEFNLGADNTLAILGTDSYKNPQAKLSAFLPVDIPGTGAKVFGFYFNQTESNPGRPEAWVIFSGASVLVKEKDAIIVLTKLKARSGSYKPILEGLKAKKVRQTKEELEKLKDKPILARNVIFDEKIDTKGIPDALLNGCMWPIDDKEKVGIKDVGSASKLRPRGKKWNKKKN